MKRTAYLILATLLSMALAPRGLCAAPLSFHVGGAVERPGDWTAARVLGDLASSAQAVRYTMKGEEHTSRCVPLWALVEAARPRIDPKVKSHRVAFAIVLRARDGYTATFSLAELAPDIGDKKVWLALDIDGKPLPGVEAPARVVVPGEGKQHLLRWISGIASITVVDGARAAEPAAAK
jgi:DMSO/TMAO reductase YedYZ molybdopterin-dependent catalytic subunit